MSAGKLLATLSGRPGSYPALPTYPATLSVRLFCRADPAPHTAAPILLPVPSPCPAALPGRLFRSA